LSMLGYERADSNLLALRIKLVAGAGEDQPWAGQLGYRLAFLPVLHAPIEGPGKQAFSSWRHGLRVGERFAILAAYGRPSAARHSSQAIRPNGELQPEDCTEGVTEPGEAVCADRIGNGQNIVAHSIGGVGIDEGLGHVARGIGYDDDAVLLRECF